MAQEIAKKDSIIVKLKQINATKERKIETLPNLKRQLTKLSQEKQMIRLQLESEIQKLRHENQRLKQELEDKELTVLSFCFVT